MSETSRNLLVGGFALVGIGALGGLAILFGEQPEWLGGRTYAVVADFTTVEGISRGMRITMSGITVGEIDRIDYLKLEHPESGVRVTLRIYSNFNIPSTATAVVESSAIGFGQSTFRIRFPEDPAQPIATDGTGRIEGKMLTANILPDTTLDALETALESVGQLGTALTPVAIDLHRLLDPVRAAQGDPTTSAPGAERVANIATAVATLNEVLDHINKVLGDVNVQSNLRDAVENIAKASQDLPTITANFKDLATQAKSVINDGRKLIASAQGTVDNTNQRINDVAERLMTITEKVSRSLDDVNKVTRNIADGKGTVGMLVSDERLYKALLLTTQRINEAISDVAALVKSLKSL